jgi:hypothetical protein
MEPSSSAFHRSLSLASFGNSDGDLAMLQWTAAGKGPRLATLVHHTDAEREWAYDRTSSIGQRDDHLDFHQRPLDRVERSEAPLNAPTA